MSYAKSYALIGPKQAHVLTEPLKIHLKAKGKSAVHVILSRFYPDFLETHSIQILSKFFEKIWIKFGFSVSFNFFLINPDFIQIF